MGHAVVRVFLALLLAIATLSPGDALTPNQKRVLLNGAGQLISFNFASGDVSGITDTRATVAPVINSDGSLSSVAINTARVSYDELTLIASGLQIEEAQSNKITSPNFTGATNGAVGVTGALPTGWSFFGGLPAGLTATIANASSTNIDLTLSGTSGATSEIILLAGGTGASGVPATAGDVWCISSWGQLISGSGLNADPGKMGVFNWTSGGGFVSSIVPTPVPLQTDQTYARQSLITVPATTAFITPIIFDAVVVMGAVVNQTFRLQRPLLEKRSVRTTFQTTDRAADVVNFKNTALFTKPPFTIELDFRANRQTNTATIWEAKLDANNRDELKLNNWLLQAVVVKGGVTTTTDIGRVPALMQSTAVLSVTGTGIAASINGKPAVVASVATPTGLTSGQIGGGTSGFINGYVAAARYYSAARSAGDVVSDAGRSIKAYDDFYRPDGAIGTAWKGGAWVQQVATGTFTVATISSNKLVTPNSAGAGTTSYSGLALGTVSNLQVEQITFTNGGTSGGLTTLVQNPSGLTAADIGPAASHIIQSDVGGQLTYFLSNSETIVVAYTLPTALLLNGSTVYNVGVAWPTDGSSVLVLPDGAYLRTTNATLKAQRGQYHMWEALKAANANAMPIFQAIGAE